MSKHQVANLLRKYGTIDVIAKHFYALEDIADTQEETILEKDAEIAKLKNRDALGKADYLVMCSEYDAEIAELKADVVELVGMLRMLFDNYEDDLKVRHHEDIEILINKHKGKQE